MQSFFPGEVSFLKNDPDFGTFFGNLKLIELFYKMNQQDTLYQIEDLKKITL